MMLMAVAAQYRSIASLVEILNVQVIQASVLGQD